MKVTLVDVKQCPLFLGCEEDCHVGNFYHKVLNGLGHVTCPLISLLTNDNECFPLDKSQVYFNIELIFQM